MSSSDVNISMTAVDSGVGAAWRNMTMQAGQFENVLDRIGRKGAAAGGRVNAGFAGVTSQMGRAMATMVGFGSAIQGIYTFASLVRREFETMKQRQESTKVQQLGVEAVLQKMAMLNMPEGSDMNISQIRQKIYNTSKRTGADPRALAAAIQQSVSSGLKAPVSERVSAPIEIAELIPGLSGEELGTLAESSMALRRAFGGSIKGRLAQAMQAMPAERTFELDKFAVNIAGGAAQIGTIGHMNSHQALALMAAIGGRAEDRTGEVTRTNAQLFLQQISEEAIGRNLVGKDFTFDELMTAVRGDSPEAAAMRKKLLGPFEREQKEIERQARRSTSGPERARLRGRARTKVPLMEFLQPEGVNNITKDLYEKALHSIRPQQEAIAAIEQRMRDYYADPASLPQQLHFARKGFEYKMQADPRRALRHQVAEFLEHARIQTGGSGVAGKIESALNRLIHKDSEMEDVLESLSLSLQRRARNMASYSGPRIPDLERGENYYQAVLERGTGDVAANVRAIEEVRDEIKKMIQLIRDAEARDKVQKVEVVGGRANVQPPDAQKLSD